MRERDLRRHLERAAVFLRAAAGVDVRSRRIAEKGLAELEAAEAILEEARLEVAADRDAAWFAETFLGREEEVA